jgi:hypothetical protein
MAIEIKVGKVHPSNLDGYFKVVEIINYKNIKVEFIDTGYTRWVQGTRIAEGSIKDRLRKSILGIACIGDGPYIAGDRRTTPRESTIYSIWHGMLERCNSTRQKSYSDCTIVEEWYNFQNFAKWAFEHLPNDYFERSYHLDKDIKVPGNRIYGPNTCQFVLAEENIKAAGESSKKTIQSKIITTIKDPNGNIYKFTDLQEFAKTHNLNVKTLQIQRKKRSTNFCGGWSILQVIDLRE